MSCEPAVVGALKREYVLNPITALAFFSSAATRRQYVLAGEDTDIKIYDGSSSRLCGQLSIFPAQSIHGIAVPPGDASRHRPPRVLVWGAHQVKVLPGELIEACIVSGHADGDGLADGVAEAEAPDWILDGRVSPFDGRRRIVLLTAHNEVIQAQVSQDQTSLTFGKIQSPSRPILYSGNFFWVSRDCVLVAAGTVFGEILVWKCNLGSDGRDPSCEVLFVFSGHEGSIFGINISPEIQSPSGEPLRLLASCSDDRTIRIWDITERRSEAGDVQGGYGSQISDARETGFGDSFKTTEHDDSTTRCVAIAMGHVSRIWQVEFAQRHHHSPAHNILEVYSFGEDATAQKWHLDLENRPPSTTPNDRLSGNNTQFMASLTHRTTFSNHSGKHIWSHAMTFINDGHLLIATGGSDGKVALIDEASPPSNKSLNGQTTLTQGPNGENQIIELSLVDVVSSCYSHPTTQNTGDTSHESVPIDRVPSAKELFFRYSFITDDRLFTISNSGRVFVGDFTDELNWRELPIPDEICKAIMGYSVVENSVANSMTFIGTTGGDLFCYQDCDGGTLRPLAKVHGKVNGIFCLSDAATMRHRTSPDYDTPEDGHSEILVTVLGSAEAELLRINSNASVSKHTKVSLKPGFTPTSAAFCRQYLVLGSRHGLVSILDRTNDGNYSPILNIKVKLKDTITSILPLPSRDDQSPIYFLITGRDGKFRIYEIKITAGGVKASLFHETSPPFGPMIEGSWFSSNPDGTQDLMLCGFRSKQFVVWNETRRQEVAAVECGGGHRNFAYSSARDDPERVRFAFTKASHMRVFSQTRTPHRTIKTGVHGREIKAVSSSGRYVATASEDTVIRIWEYRRGATLRCLAALERHATGIQTLRWSGSDYLFSSGGNEEFFVWRVSTLDGYGGLAVVCEAVFPDRSEVGDLRITDFDVERVASDASGSKDDDGDDGSPPHPRFCVSMALSNSTLQSYAYSPVHGFRLLGRQRYTGACLTQARHLRLLADGRPQVLTAATDGHIAIYADMRLPPPAAAAADDEPSKSVPAPNALVTRLHQNTIKALDVRAVSDEAGTGTGISYLVVTGGDDNALGIMHIWSPSSSSSSSSPQYQVKSKSTVKSAHAAAITGVAIARLGSREGGGGGGGDRETDTAVVVTASNDQRVRAWELVGWRRPGGAPRVRLLGERYSSVADAGDLEVLGGDGDGDGGLRVMVGGVGVEVWRLGGL